jgi:Transposase
MESTSVYWRPVYHVLVSTVEVLVGNAQEMRRHPGHKTDKADARWIAELLAHGLIRPSFVPPPPIGALRDGCLGATEHKTGLRKVLDPKIPNHIPFWYLPTTDNDRFRPALNEHLRTDLDTKNQSLRSELRASPSS